MRSCNNFYDTVKSFLILLSRLSIFNEIFHLFDFDSLSHRNYLLRNLSEVSSYFHYLLSQSSVFCPVSFSRLEFFCLFTLYSSILFLFCFVSKSLDTLLQFVRLYGQEPPCSYSGFLCTQVSSVLVIKGIKPLFVFTYQNS